VVFSYQFSPFHGKVVSASVKVLSEESPLTQPGHKIPRTEPKITRTEPKVPKPNFSVPCSVPNFQEPEVNSVLYLGEPNIPNLPKYVEFECNYIINSTILVYYILYMWYYTHIILWTCICMYLTLLFFKNYFQIMSKLAFELTIICSCDQFDIFW